MVRARDENGVLLSDKRYSDRLRYYRNQGLAYAAADPTARDERKRPVTLPHLKFMDGPPRG